MDIVIYNNQTKYIACVRHDASTNIEKPTAEFWLIDYTQSNNFNFNYFSVVEIAHDKNRNLIIGRDKFDESNNTIYADPDWVEPVKTPAPTPTE